RWRWRIDKDLGIRRLAECEQLQHLQVNTSISSTTLIMLFRFCPQLQDLTVWKLNDVDTAEMAVEIFRSLGEFRNRNIRIRLSDCGYGFTLSGWKMIDDVLKDLKEKDKCSIEFKYDNVLNFLCHSMEENKFVAIP